MRTFASRATLVAGLLAVTCVASAAWGQQPPLGQTPAAPGANAPKFGIAVVDINYIFKNHNRFKAQMERMKQEVDATEGDLREERKLIGKREEQLQGLNAGTPEYKTLDEQITTMKSEFNLKATKQRKEFLEKEAKIYYQTYLEVNDAVKYFAQRNNIGLVLRFNGDPIDPNKREDVLRAINKPVVFDNGLDITPDILRGLNRTATAGTPGAGGAVPRTANQVPVTNPGATRRN